MEICRTIAEVRRRVQSARAAGHSIGFVPTMGALHAGHASLIDAASKDGHFIVVSIFVNPTQFGPGEDYQKYPRAVDVDARLCRDHQADLLYMPEVAEIYPPGDPTRVRPGRLAETLCGRSRPGHFEGVCTVVTKLFNIIRPDAAYFGQKDAQQVVIIQRMAADLFHEVRIAVCPIVREPDGLALSSRNAYLAPAERRQAASLYAALCTGRDLIRGGERRAGNIIARVAGVLHDAGPCTPEYIAVVDPRTLQDQHEVRTPAMLALAVRIGTTRLIDNLVVE